MSFFQYIGSAIGVDVSDENAVSVQVDTERLDDTSYTTKAEASHEETTADTIHLVGGHVAASQNVSIKHSSEVSEEEKKDADHHDDLSFNLKDTIDHHEHVIEITNLGSEVHHRLSKTKSKDDGSTSTATSVSFGSVQVREYERVIDSTEKYMGLALGWNYNEIAPSPLKERNHASKYSMGKSHGGDETKMKRTNGSDRYGMMVRYGYATKELKQATKEAATFYEQRQRDAARSLVMAEQRTKQGTPQTQKRRPLLRSMFG
jgi:hypothetical protein